MATATKPKKRHGGPRKGAGRAKSICGAIKADGDPCTRGKGWGTDHGGTGRCKFHGGRSPDGRTAAVAERANSLTQPLDVDPGSAILGIMRSAAGEVAWAQGELYGLDDADIFNEQAGEHPVLRFKHRAEERLAKYARTAVDIGIETAKVRMAETQLAMIGRLVEAVIARLDLTEEQRKQLGPAIRDELAPFIRGDAKEITNGR